MVGVRIEEVLKTTREAVQRKTLYRCLTCEAIMEYQLHDEWFRRGGNLYNLAEQTYGKLRSDKKYSFPQQGKERIL
jgi:deubiquitinating protein VCIP135